MSKQRRIEHNGANGWLYTAQTATQMVAVLYAGGSGPVVAGKLAVIAGQHLIGLKVTI